MSALRFSACTAPKMMSISSRLRPFVSGMSLSCVLGCMSALAEGTESAGKEKGDAQGEDGHAADVDRREHEEELVAEPGLQRRRHLRHDKVYMGMRCASALGTQQCITKGRVAREAPLPRAYVACESGCE